MELNAELVQRLVRTDVAGQPVVSMYLNVDGRTNVRPEDYCRNLESLLRKARGKASGKSAVSDLDKVEAFVKSEFERKNTRGLAIFSAGEHLWEVVAIPLPVTDYLVVDRAVHVRRLENVLDEHPPTGVLLTDKQRARLFVIELSRIIERAEVSTPQPRHDDIKGEWEKDHVKTHASVVAQQHLKSAAQAMFDLFQRRSFRFLVIGAAQELAPDVQKNLHSYLSQKVVGVTQIGINASDDEIITAVWDLTQKAERTEELVYIDRLRAQLSASSDGTRGPTAVAGLSSTLRAIEDKRADTLLVTSGFATEGMRCEVCGYIASSETTCPSCKGPMAEVDDVIEDAIERALAQKCHVEFCHEEADISDLGNIAAILRY